MSIEIFIQHFINQFEDVEENLTVNKKTRYKELKQWDSLTSLLVIAMVDEKYGVTINGNDMAKTESLLDLFNLIKSKKGEDK